MTILKSPQVEAKVEVASVGIGKESLSRWRLRLSTPACFGVAILLGAIAVGLGTAGAPDSVSMRVLIAAYTVFGFSILIALARTLIGLVKIVQAARGAGDLTVGRAVMITAGNFFMAAFGAYLALLATFSFSRGRQLRRRGRVLLPALRENDEWTGREMTLDQAAAPAGLADQWRENGKTEHASVAAFARLTLDLMALGAPPALIAGANQDSLDEIRHAELCFSLAAALDGRRSSPAPFPEAQRVATLPRTRPLALASLAVSSLVDGALHEGVSARIIAQLAKRCGVPAIREMLLSIAADEGRHSAHGWAVVEWCLEQGGTGVGEALLGALRALPPQVRTAVPEPAMGGGWERWGIHGHALEDAEYGAAVAHVGERVRALVSPRARRAA
jgi:hypothetical protein